MLLLFLSYIPMTKMELWFIPSKGSNSGTTSSRMNCTNRSPFTLPLTVETHRTSDAPITAMADTRGAQTIYRLMHARVPLKLYPHRLTKRLSCRNSTFWKPIATDPTFDNKPKGKLCSNQMHLFSIATKHYLLTNPVSSKNRIICGSYWRILALYSALKNSLCCTATLRS